MNGGGGNDTHSDMAHLGPALVRAAALAQGVSRLDVMTNEHDTQQTRDHIARVQQLLTVLINDLEERAAMHDASKLLPPERDAFASIGHAAYGSPEYEANLIKLGPALEHHYACNSHHPQHYADGIDGMTLMDIVEMFADWKAASERHPANTFLGRKRAGLCNQLYRIFQNTAKELGW